MTREVLRCNGSPPDFPLSYSGRAFRNLKFRACLAISLALFSPAIPSYPQSRPSGPEKVLFDSANRERAEKKLPPLGWDAALAAAAKPHAAMMAQRNTLSHQFPGEAALQERTAATGAKFSMVAENVAMGPTAAGIHAQWMHSPPHRRNILDRDLTAMGISVVQRNGQLFAVQDFSHAVVKLSLQEQETQIGKLIAARGIQVKKDGGDGRKTCGMDRGWTGPRPKAVVRFEASDLSLLPEKLEQRIAAGGIQFAIVGTCKADGSAGFSRFRAAVLLF